MIRFFLTIIIITLLVRKNQKHYYFNSKIISNKYNLSELRYIYYDNNNMIRKDKMIILNSDIEEIIEILEECFNKKIKIKGK